MTSLTHLTVLVAEDERPVRMLLRVVLEGAGARVIEAEDGMQALRMLALHPEVDVVCTDINMPNLDGIQLSHAVRARRPDVALVACTALDLASHPSRLRDVVDLVVRKPFVPAELVRAIGAARELRVPTPLARVR